MTEPTFTDLWTWFTTSSIYEVLTTLLIVAIGLTILIIGLRENRPSQAAETFDEVYRRNS